MATPHSDRRAFLRALIAAPVGARLLLAQTAPAQAPAPTPIKALKIKANLAVLSGDGGNIGVLIEPGSLMAIDTGYDNRSAGAIIVAALGNVRHKGRIALVMLTCLGAGIAGFALSTSVWLSCLMLFFSGASLIAVFTLVNSLVQLITTNEMRGRVMSVYNFAFRGGMPMGNLLTGWLVPMFSAPLVLAVNGLVLMAVALYFLGVQRRVAAL